MMQRIVVNSTTFAANSCWQSWSSASDSIIAPEGVIASTTRVVFKTLSFIGSNFTNKNTNNGKIINFKIQVAYTNPLVKRSLKEDFASRIPRIIIQTGVLIFERSSIGCKIAEGKWIFATKSGMEIISVIEVGFKTALLMEMNFLLFVIR